MLTHGKMGNTQTQSRNSTKFLGLQPVAQNYTVNLKTTLGVGFAYTWGGPSLMVFHFTIEIDNPRDGNFEGGFFHS